MEFLLEQLYHNLNLIDSETLYIRGAQMTNRELSSIQECIEIWRRREKEFVEQGAHLHADHARECAERFEKMLKQ